MSDDFAYINARIGAMKGRLLKPHDFEMALATDGLDALVAFLDVTPYGPDVEAALTLHKGLPGVDEGLRRNFQKVLDRLIGMSSGHARELIYLVLGRWEVFNLKTILRGKHFNALPETILAATLPFGRLDDVALADLARRDNVKDVIEVLVGWGHPLAPTLRRAYPAYKSLDDLQGLENELDRSSFQAASTLLDRDDPDDAIALDYLRRGIDLTLISLAVMAVHHGQGSTEVNRLYLPGGRDIDLPTFRDLLASRSLEDLASRLEGTAWRAAVDESLARFEVTRHLAVFERILEEALVRATCRAMHRDPLSLVPVIDYSWRKGVEVSDLRIIARGKGTGIPRLEIEHFLTRH